jgi:hypothetical protein
MSENIEGAAAKRAASGAGRSSGTFAGLVGYMLGRGGKKRGSGGGRGPQTAADYHNEEIAKRYEFERENTRTLRDWQIDESKANTGFTREEGAKNNDFTRTRAANEDATKIRRGELAAAARTAKRTGVSNLAVQADGGFNLAMFDRPDTPASPAKTIAPAKSTVPKGKQFTPPAPAAPARTPRAPRGGSKPKGTGTPPKGLSGLPAAGSGDVSITGFPHRA